MQEKADQVSFDPLSQRIYELNPKRIQQKLEWLATQYGLIVDSYQQDHITTKPGSSVVQTIKSIYFWEMVQTPARISIILDDTGVFLMQNLLDNGIPSPAHAEQYAYTRASIEQLFLRVQALIENLKKQIKQGIIT